MLVKIFQHKSHEPDSPDSQLGTVASLDLYSGHVYAEGHPVNWRGRGRLWNLLSLLFTTVQRHRYISAAFVRPPLLRRQNGCHKPHLLIMILRDLNREGFNLALCSLLKRFL